MKTFKVILTIAAAAIPAIIEVLDNNNDSEGKKEN